MNEYKMNKDTETIFVKHFQSSMANVNIIKNVVSILLVIMCVQSATFQNTN